MSALGCGESIGVWFRNAFNPPHAYPPPQVSLHPDALPLEGYPHPNAMPPRGCTPCVVPRPQFSSPQLSPPQGYLTLTLTPLNSRISISTPLLSTPYGSPHPTAIIVHYLGALTTVLATHTAPCSKAT